MPLLQLTRFEPQVLNCPIWTSNSLEKLINSFQRAEFGLDNKLSNEQRTKCLPASVLDGEATGAPMGQEECYRPLSS